MLCNPLQLLLRRRFLGAQPNALPLQLVRFQRVKGPSPSQNWKRTQSRVPKMSLAATQEPPRTSSLL